MNKSIFSFTAAIALLLLASAFPLAADTTYIQAGIGYRQDSITLNLKDQAPTELRVNSKRHFKDLEILLLGANMKTTLGCWDAYARASFDYGFVLDGKLQERLIAKNVESSGKFKHQHVVGGEYFKNTVHDHIKSNSFVWDVNVALACPVFCEVEGLEIAPAIGFSVDRQHLHIKERADDFDHFLFSNGFVTTQPRKHKSSFRSCWWSPWIGFDFAYNPCNNWDLYGTFEFHIGKAHRKVESSIVTGQFSNYKRSKTFYGPLVKLGAIYMFCENWYADANITYRKYFSDTNRDHLSWASGSVRLDVGYVF